MQVPLREGAVTVTLPVAILLPNLTPALIGNCYLLHQRPNGQNASWGRLFLIFPAKTQSPGAETDEAERAGSRRPGALDGGDVVPRSHLAMSGDVSGCHRGARALWVESGMLYTSPGALDSRPTPNSISATGAKGEERQWLLC